MLGPVSDAAAVCSADSVPSVSPAPVHAGHHPRRDPHKPVRPQVNGMDAFGREFRANREA